MKYISLIFSFLLAFTFFAQKTLDVKLILKYKNSPLCNWDVTIKHGDVAIAKSKSNEKGEVVFKNATILSLSIDAYGYKAFNGGDKKWDVKGYIQLNDQGFAEFDFEPLVKDAGMPVSMLESAWGLTINDCGGIVASAPKSEEKSSTSSSTTKTEEAKPVEEEEKYTVKDMQQDMKQSMDNMKLMHENKISNLTSKIEKKTKQRDALDSKSKEYSTLAYEVRDLELEKEITKIKLEKVNLQISKGYKPLNKSEKEPLDSKEDAFSIEQKSLKKKEKEGLFFGSTEIVSNSKPVVTKPTETKPKEAPKTEVKTEKEGVKSEVKTEKEEINTEIKTDSKIESTESKPANTSEKESIKIYSESDLAVMSVVNLKRIKLEYNTLIAKWKVTLKTKSSFLKPAEIEKYKADIVKVEAQVKLFDAEITKRSAAKG